MVLRGLLDFVALAGLAWSMGCSGGGGGAATPSVPSSAMLDAYDTAVLASTASDAPTFAEVAGEPDAPPQPRGDGADAPPLRFRAWLGWSWPACDPCPWDQAATCTPQCRPGKAFVCVRPSRTLACRPEETVSTRVEVGSDALPAAGVYVFEGRWSAPDPGGPAPPELTIDRITPVHLPVDTAP